MNCLQVANIIVIKEGVVAENIAIVAIDSNIVSLGKYKGKRLSDALEEEFYLQCRKINPSLPEVWEGLSEEELPENFPSFDDGFYAFTADGQFPSETTVCLTWADLLLS